MRCLSVRQPWAWLICAGHKDIENRTWFTRKVRGEILIHAGWIMDEEGLARVRIEHPDIALPAEFVRGAIIGRVNLVDCLRDHPSPWAEKDHWHWVLTDPVLFAEPIPYKGEQGLFKVPDEVLK